MQHLVKGIGVDIADVKRFRKLPFRRNRSFYAEIFTSAEIRYCMAKHDPYPHFAARFAAKEAVIKSSGGRIYGLKRIEIISGQDGKPAVKAKSGKNILVSLSHDGDYAVAFSIWLE